MKRNQIIQITFVLLFVGLIAVSSIPVFGDTPKVSCSLMAQTVAASLTSAEAVTQRLRVVMSSDFPPIGVVKSGNVPNTQKSDPDDMQSMVRFLLYANEFDIEGLIASSGTFANIAKKQNILGVIDRYEMVYNNLKTHDPRYPTADSLRAVTFQGRSGTWGKSVSNNIGAGKDSEASEAIIAIVDKPDPRPVYIGVWGDCSNIAQAIWKVQNTRSAAELETFLSKIRIHQIAHQDDTIDWLLQNFPNLFIIYSRTTYQGMFGGSDPISNLAWVNENIRFNHGPLCEVYPREGMGCTGVCEGDSPSFLWLVSANRGLNDPDDPTQPSWGGQFRRDGTTHHYVDGPGGSSISRWRPVYQAEFQERANWCIESALYSDPNLPVLKTPLSAQKNVAVLTPLQWTAPTAYTPTFYEVFFGPNAVVSENPSTIVDTNEFQPADPLAYKTTYYWVVVAYDGTTPHASVSRSFTTVHQKPRIINTTDLGADPDDQQSMVRFLVCSNEYDVEGLIVATSCWKKSQSNTDMLDHIIDAYGQVYDNLVVHADGYPTPEYLRSISVLGQDGYGMGDVGVGKDSEGSNLIIAAVDMNDPRPVWVTCWGGANNVAQAVWKVQHTRSAAELKKFISKLRVFDILGQDDAGAWLAKNFPDLFYIRATGVYGWQPSTKGDQSWINNNIRNHGPLGAEYPPIEWSQEGDTPAFMHVYPNGLNDPNQIDQGGWGGRFSLTKTANLRGMSEVAKINPNGESQYDPYYMYSNTSEGANAISRWSAGYDNDFEARMDWSITSDYSGANHHPIAVVNDDGTRQIMVISAAAGSSVALSAEGSSDPDGDSLAYSWTFYSEPSSYTGNVSIQHSSSASATVAIPLNAGGKTIHVILELHDDGSPNLYAYRRVIINVHHEIIRR